MPKERKETYLMDRNDLQIYIHIANYIEGKDYPFDVGITCPTGFNSATKGAKSRIMLQMPLEKRNVQK
jgi:hypothetical protein